VRPGSKILARPQFFQQQTALLAFVAFLLAPEPPDAGRFDS
jgi:hypothetical protein